MVGIRLVVSFAVLLSFAQGVAEEVVNIDEYRRTVDDDMVGNQLLIVAFFPKGKSEPLFLGYKALADDHTIWEGTTMDHEKWPFLYSFDLEIAKEAGCYDAETADRYWCFKDQIRTLSHHIILLLKNRRSATNTTTDAFCCMCCPFL